MRLDRLVSLLAILLATAAAPIRAAEAPAQYVIQISVDGLGSSYLESLLKEGQLPTFARLRARRRLDAQCPHRFRLHDHAAQSHLHGHRATGKGQSRKPVVHRRAHLDRQHRSRREDDPRQSPRLRAQHLRRGARPRPAHLHVRLEEQVRALRSTPTTPATARPTRRARTTDATRSICT